MKIIFPDYDHCLVNLTNSLLKHYGSETSHKTLFELDEYLNRSNYKNIILLLYDGLGTNLVKRILGEESFLFKNKIMDITSVFPATTTASTTTITSGLNPVEHCWLGWDIYVESLDKTVSMYTNVLKGTDIQASDKNISKEEFSYKSIFEKINDTGNAKAYCISPFEGIRYTKNDSEEMYNKIIELCKKDERKFIYIYSTGADSLMHELGTKSDTVVEKMKYIDKKTEELSNHLNDSLLIVTGDHGHMDAEWIVLEEYSELQNMLIRETSIENRATNFFVKREYLDDFKTKFEYLFKDDFILLSKQEVIDRCLFGYGNAHPKFHSCLGDYLALGVTTKAFIDKRKDIKHKGLHAGITEDEVIVPLIIIDRKL